jgi:hypothetical protein
MRKFLVVAALLLSAFTARAAAPEASARKTDEMVGWFQTTGVRWAIYTEYVMPIDLAQTASLKMWASKKVDSTKPGFAKTQVSYLAGATKEAERFQARWSEGIKEVLKVPTLSRDEADRILGYMIERREAA